MIKRLISVFVLVLTTGFCTLAHAEWVSFSGQGLARPEIKIDQQTDQRLQLDITLSGVEIESLAIGGSDYTQVRIPGHWFTLDLGQPELPFITSTLIIPDEGNPVVRVTKSTWREIGTNPVVPSKGNIPRTVDPSTVPYSFGDAYSSGGIYPAQEANLARPFIMRDYRGVSLRINAVRWDVDSGQLLALESMTLEVETSGTGGINVKQRPNKGGQPGPIDSQFANLYSLGFDNYPTANKYNMVPVDGRILMVSHDSFMGIIQPFVEWKRSAGLTVELIPTGSVGGTTAGIQGVVDALYAEPEGLTYVILIGDQAQVPSYSGTYEGADDDTRYGNLEGDDFYPDLFVSRISGSNPADIQTQINKFIRYERDPDVGGDWYHTSAGLASNQGTPSDLERAGWLREDLLNYNFTQVHEIYQPEGTTEDIAAAVNAGVSLINYIGHGTGSSWTNPYFNVSSIQALTNGWKNPWILDISCSNGDFSQDECFAESWLRAGNPEQPQGALAIYSASTTTPWVPPCIMQAEAVDLLVADQANVLGSLYYHGMMKVMDEYPGNVQVVEQYNIFGDCSLMIRTDTPMMPNMFHDDVIAIGATVFPVDTGLENSRVAIYSNGQLHGVGVTDASGHVDVALVNPVAVPGEVTMTVTGYNLLTQIITLQGEVPIQVDIQPASIVVGVNTEITITLVDPPAEKTVNNVTVTIEGFGVSGLEAVTGADGVAVFSVTPEFGETLLVRGVEEGAGYDMFKRGLAVTGATDLTNAQIFAEVPTIGMSGTLAPNIEGTVTGTSDVPDFDLRLTGLGLDLHTVGSGTTVVQNVTPNSTGTVFATLLKSGHNIYEVEIDVVPANGFLSGTVTVSGSSDGLNAVRVFGFHEGDDPGGEPLFDLVTDASGAYTVTTQMPVGNYDLYAEKYGYSDYLETFALMHGVNNHGIAMELAPVGVLSGRVSELADDSPVVDAIIQIFRLDNNDQMALVQTNESGNFTSPALPYYDYRITVNAYLFEVQSLNITFAQPVTVQNFQMVPTNGKILIVDHNSTFGKSGQYGPKFGNDGEVIAEGYDAPETLAASDLVADLTTLNFTSDLVSSSSYTYDDWFSYDLVLVSAGSNSSNFPTTLKDDMLRFVAAGGKLLVEGGEVGYNNREDLEFSSNVLHMSYWRGDYVSGFSVQDPNHAVMSVPNTIVGPLSMSYSGYGDADVVSHTEDASWPASWTSAPTRASIVCYDPNPAPEGGQIVYFSFNYSALDAVGRIDILHNAVTYLSLQELGTSTLTGRVRVHGATDDSDVTLTLTPGNSTFQTGPDGSFTFWGMVEGAYQITASRPGFSTSVADVVLIDGELVNQDMYLVAIVTNTFCSAPDVDIPDNDSDFGVYSTITIDETSTVRDLGVFVDISHTSVEDLVVDLISPAGTTVRLHRVQPGGEHGLVGWYPTDITPYEDLSVFLGESLQGDWLLHVMDVEPDIVGHFNSWCLVLSYAENVVSPVAQDDLPKVLSLDGNHPNPFNPMTTIQFSVPQSSNAELAVYDVRGVRVRTLLNGVIEAGRHEVTWAGRDDFGRTVSSGAYFYRLTSNGQNLVGKMLLIK